MAKAAVPYMEGETWSMRRRIKGQDLYVCGCTSATAARRKMEDRIAALSTHGKPAALGPERTTMAQALQDYGLEVLPFKKGSSQVVRRINKFLRAAGLRCLVLKPKSNAPESSGLETALDDASHQGSSPSSDGSSELGRYFTVSLGEVERERKIPKGLATHRGEQAQKSAHTNRLLKQLAFTMVAEVTSHQLQMLINALLSEGLKPSSVLNEFSIVSQLFSYSIKVWNWRGRGNPATGLIKPALNNKRERVMSRDEEQRLHEALRDTRNPLISPMVLLLTETAMRTSEPMRYTSWKHVDWEGWTLRLTDSKGSVARDVPLSDEAIAALRHLQQLVPHGPDDPICSLTYEALKAAWNRVCERAGIEDLHIHDLRHTAATRLALETGNPFLVKVLTGHKTWSQVERYVNIKASDVVEAVYRKRAQATAQGADVPVESEDQRTARPISALPEQAEPMSGSQPDNETSNVVQVDFGRRRIG